MKATGQAANAILSNEDMLRSEVRALRAALERADERAETAILTTTSVAKEALDREERMRKHFREKLNEALAKVALYEHTLTDVRAYVTKLTGNSREEDALRMMLQADHFTS